MKFKIWLENNVNLHSWLSPQGEIYPAGVLGHYSSAAEILGPSSNPKEALNILMKKGWQRLNYYRYDLTSNNSEGIFPNQKQMKVLVDLAAENGMETVEFDNDEKTWPIWNRSLEN